MMISSNGLPVRLNLGAFPSRKTVSDLLRRGLNAPASAQESDGVVMFRLPSDSPTVTTDQVRRFEAEGL